MTRLIPKNEAVLRAVLKLVKATSQDVEDSLGYPVIPAIKSLHTCGLLETVAKVRRTTKVGHSRDMRVYAITEHGRQKLSDADFPPVRKMQALKVPAKRPQPKPQPQPMKSPPPPKSVQKDSVPMRAVPDKHVSVNVMMAEIDGREVKITYGAGFEYEVYRPAPDRSRNYTPRPIRGILA